MQTHQSYKTQASRECTDVGSLTMTRYCQLTLLSLLAHLSSCRRGSEFCRGMHPSTCCCTGAEGHRIRAPGLNIAPPPPSPSRTGVLLMAAGSAWTGDRAGEIQDLSSSCMRTSAGWRLYHISTLGTPGQQREAGN